MEATHIKVAVLTATISSFLSVVTPAFAIVQTINQGKGNSIDSGEHYVIGDTNTITNSAASGNNVIYGDRNTLDGSDYSLIGQANTLNGGYGSIIGDGNQITSSNGHSALNNVVGNFNHIEGNNINTRGSGNKITGDDNVSIGNKTTMNADNSVAIGTGTTNDRDNTVSFGSTGSERNITNVAAGTENTDGVNVSQLNDKATETVKSTSNYIDSKIIDTKEKLNTSILNAKKEAINTSNVYMDKKYQQEVNYTDDRYAHSITYADSAANQAELNANNYTDNKFNQLNDSSNRRFNHLGDTIYRAEKRLNAGIAGVTAIASIPYIVGTDFSYGIGLGNYQNGNALAVGTQYEISPNTHVRLNVSWDSSSNSALGMGFASGW